MKKKAKLDAVNGDLIFYGWIGILVAIAVFFDSKFGKQYDENGKEIK